MREFMIVPEIFRFFSLVGFDQWKFGERERESDFLFELKEVTKRKEG